MFNDHFLEEKLKKMNIRQQARMIKTLNKLSKNYKGMIKRREVPTYKRRPIARSFVRIKDLFTVIQVLMMTKKRTVVHFALDMYIILLCGQRYLADHEIIQNGILRLLALNHGKAN